MEHGVFLAFLMQHLGIFVLSFLIFNLPLCRGMLFLNMPHLIFRTVLHFIFFCFLVLSRNYFCYSLKNVKGLLNFDHGYANVSM